MDACKSWYLITTQERPAQLLIVKDGFNMAEVDAEKDSDPMMSYSGSIDIREGNTYLLSDKVRQQYCYAEMQRTPGQIKSCYQEVSIMKDF